MDCCRDNRSKQNVCNEEYVNVYLAFLYLKLLNTCLVRGMMFENVKIVFLFLEKYVEIGKFLNVYIYRSDIVRKGMNPSSRSRQTVGQAVLCNTGMAPGQRYGKV